MGLRRVVAVAFPDVQILDVTGPLEVFSMATRLLDRPGHGYRVELVANTDGSVRASSGLELMASPLDKGRGAIDTLMVAGGLGTRGAMRDAALISWIRRAAKRSTRVTSVCSGAFLLAEAGLLDGRKATTHWEQCDRLARRFPTVDVDADPIFVKDGNVYTSAGVTAGMDLALALVEDDHGPALALDVARQLVLFMKRPGSQSQFSGHLTAQLADRQPLRELQGWLGDHLDEDLSVSALAERVNMSTRTFARAFRAEVGTTPADYVEQLRVGAARHWMETTDRAIPEVARACGFGTTETMYRAFNRAVRVSPAEYRRRFRPASA
ncbi:MAG: GlxA family transcriptional regulator [Actinobacteria bacterium]|nr:GlxA family transcriptional regulator [Actinomycetota bacterium]